MSDIEFTITPIVNKVTIAPLPVSPRYRQMSGGQVVGRLPTNQMIVDSNPTRTSFYTFEQVFIFSAF